MTRGIKIQVCIYYYIYLLTIRKEKEVFEK